MSSHHVVRESQEPALLILQPEQLSGVHIGPLLEWSPTIVVAGGALQQVLASGLKVDVVVFQAAQEKDVRQQIISQTHVTLISVKEQENLLLKALNFLAEMGQQAVNILTDSAAADEKLLLALMEQEIVPNVVLLDEKEKWALFRAGKFSKWYPAHEKVGIRSASEEATLSTKGLVENISDTAVKGLNFFQTSQSATITIASDSAFWLIEQLD